MSCFIFDECKFQKTKFTKVVYTRYIFLIYIYRRLFDISCRAQPINPDKTILNEKL